MKAISLIQPWASLIVMGAKKFETRSWKTEYRGELLIHASSKLPTQFQKQKFTEGAYFKDYIDDLDQLPYGAIIGKANLVGIYRTEDLVSPQSLFKDVSINEHEKAFGDYSHGRYAWALDEAFMFKTPIPYRGALGIWEFPADLLPK
jgi:ASCH domain.